VILLVMAILFVGLFFFYDHLDINHKNGKMHGFWTICVDYNIVRMGVFEEERKFGYWKTKYRKIKREKVNFMFTMDWTPVDGYYLDDERISKENENGLCYIWNVREK
jgi:hypothetical protein